jgi:hypothetical protein
VRSTAGRECWEPDRSDKYARRRPEETLLHALVREHWPLFLARAEEAGGLPRFVVREFEEYLRCGLLEHGVVRPACRQCGHEMRVAFSCKRRGFCPSCVGRRMSDVAAHLVDEVLPEEPIRQWVCSLPWSLRYALAYDRQLCADVLGAFIRALTRSLRRRAKRHLDLRSVDEAQVGAVTFIQRSDSALRLNVHFHTLALDGVYVRDAQGALVFHARPPPSGRRTSSCPRPPTTLHTCASSRPVVPRLRLRSLRRDAPLRLLGTPLGLDGVARADHTGVPWRVCRFTAPSPSS